MLKRISILFLLSAVALALRVPPQEPDVNSRLKALYIYNFTNMVEWPKELKTGNFNIGVFGETNLITELSKYNSKSVGSQPIRVSEYKHADEISSCHILFITKEKSGQIGDLVKKLKSKNTLIITEKEGAMKDGAIINFIIRNNKQSYELSKTNAGKHKLVIGKQLTDLAVKVE